MLEIYGRGYISEHCVVYMARKMDERRYMAYITDALMAIADNTARFAGGSVMGKRWYDAYKPVDTRTGDEIAAEVIKNAGLIPKGGET